MSEFQEEDCPKELPNPVFELGDHIPIIIQRGETSQLEMLDRTKFMCPAHFQGHQLIAYLRKQLALPKQSALFLFINGKTLVHPHGSLTVLYEQYQRQDGILYISYSEQEVMG